jgi:hypothetical protein
MKTRLNTLFVVLIVAAFISACGTPSSDTPQGEAMSVLTEQEASRMIESALQAFNSGDYNTWSRDWDDAMKAAIRDADFQQYRDQVISQYGPYISLESLEILPGLNKGNVRWVAVASFEKGQIKFTFGFPNDSRKISGLFPEDVK